MGIPPPPPLSLSLSLSPLITLEMGILSFQHHQTSQAHFCLSSFPSQMETPDSPLISKEEHATLQGERLYYFGSSFSPTHSYDVWGFAIHAFLGEPATHIHTMVNIPKFI
jgi:hypothetical protein